MAITQGSNANASDFINESERDATPANDEGRVPKLESNGKLHDAFINRPVNVQEFAADGTWEKPESGTWAFIEMWGAGASGAANGNSGDKQAATGGGGGQYRAALVPVSILSSTESVVVGVGGAAVAAARSSDQAFNGNDGETTSFGSVCSAQGGIKGVYGNNGTFNGGAGGSTGTDVFNTLKNENGGAGGNATATAGSATADAGAATVFSGAGGAGVAKSTTAAGGASTYGGDGGDSFEGNGSADSGQTPGGGGGGATCNGGGQVATSGEGGDGFCRVTVF